MLRSLPVAECPLPAVPWFILYVVPGSVAYCYQGDSVPGAGPVPAQAALSVRPFRGGSTLVRSEKLVQK